MIEKVPRKPVLLVILDGVGINPDRSENAFALANKPRLDYFFSHYPFALLDASGKSVGLPDGQMGNSEVGHLTLGSGAILKQDLVRIDDSIEDKSFFLNQELCDAIDNAGKKNRPIHLIGLVSDGGVHSHINHLFALIELCARHRVKPVVHVITDGRDTPPKSALNYIDRLDEKLKFADGSIATVTGRFYAMDRDKRWDRTTATWKILVHGEGKRATSARDAIENAYANGVTDEFIEPTVIENATLLRNGDNAIFFNFRNDRARQLTYILAGEDFKPFDRGADFEPMNVTCLTEYDPALPLPVAFPNDDVENTLASVLSDNHIAQFHCAETEKYAHVTFFFNGGLEKPFPLEDRVMVPSPKVVTYDLSPEMSAKYITDEVVVALKSNRYGFIVVNYANGDMVGHTAVKDAAIKAVETLDREVGRLLDVAITQRYTVLLTADHGNCELLKDPITGEPHTQHTTFPVPCLLVDDSNYRLKQRGGLSQIAPTVLELMGLKAPSSMSSSLLLNA